MRAGVGAWTADHLGVVEIRVHVRIRREEPGVDPIRDVRGVH